MLTLTAEAALSGRRRSPARGTPGPRTGRRRTRWRPASSGCHCTATSWASPRSSTASITSSAAQATGRSPAPSRSMAWWCQEGTDEISVAPSRPASRESAATRTACEAASVWLERCTTFSPTTSGRWTWRSPPSATFRICMPRQIASVGRPRSRAPRRQRDLERIALGRDRVDAGVGIGAVAGRVQVSAARQHQPIEPCQQLLGRRLSRRHQHRQAVRRPERIDVGARQCEAAATGRLAVVGGDSDQRARHRCPSTPLRCARSSAGARSR